MEMRTLVVDVQDSGKQYDGILNSLSPSLASSASVAAAGEKIVNRQSFGKIFCQQMALYSDENAVCGYCPGPRNVGTIQRFTMQYQQQPMSTRIGNDNSFPIIYTKSFHFRVSVLKNIENDVLSCENYFKAFTFVGNDIPLTRIKSLYYKHQLEALIIQNTLSGNEYLNNKNYDEKLQLDFFKQGWVVQSIQFESLMAGAVKIDSIFNADCIFISDSNTANQRSKILDILFLLSMANISKRLVVQIMSDNEYYFLGSESEIEVNYDSNSYTTISASSNGRNKGISFKHTMSKRREQSVNIQHIISVAASSVIDNLDFIAELCIRAKLESLMWRSY